MMTAGAARVQARGQWGRDAIAIDGDGRKTIAIRTADGARILGAGPTFEAALEGASLAVAPAPLDVTRGGVEKAMDAIALERSRVAFHGAQEPRLRERLAAVRAEAERLEDELESNARLLAEARAGLAKSLARARDIYTKATGEAVA